MSDEVVSPPARLLLEFGGWCLMRLPTDPDPTDEPRGVSGYTFAFGNEPDLDRVIRFQPERKYIRSQSPEQMGVFVTEAARVLQGGRSEPLADIVGAAVDLEDGPKLENRNWTLTLPGFEPIVPFKLRIRNEAVNIFRNSLLDPDIPHLEVWKASPEVLQRTAASGMNREPDTVGRATGIWDFGERAYLRWKTLIEERNNLPPGSEDQRAILTGRIEQLAGAIADWKAGRFNRRIGLGPMVERFAFWMGGRDAEVSDPGGVLRGMLDIGRDADWQISFWIGGWDPDLLMARVQGTLLAPYATLAEG